MIYSYFADLQSGLTNELVILGAFGLIVLSLQTLILPLQYDIEAF